MQDWRTALLEDRSLTAAEAEALFDRFMDGSAEPVEMAAVLTAMKVRGETPAEVAGGVRALRKAMVPVELPGGRHVDTCGTGGGTVRTFNISTAAGLVAAGGGISVAKHGNRSFSSRCGSADVLERLGVAIDLDPPRLVRIFERTGFAFMFAPRFHPAMRHVAPVRRALGVSTIMNLLGPLASPARVRRQVVGVAEPERLRLVAEALCELGHVRALVVHGEPGLDELSPLGTSRLISVQHGELTEYEVAPRDFGWSGMSAEELAGGGPAENAERVEAVLKGEASPGARAAVVINAAAAFYVGGLAGSLEEGARRAERSIDSGAAWETVRRLREESGSGGAAEAAPEA